MQTLLKATKIRNEFKYKITQTNYFESTVSVYEVRDGVANFFANVVTKKENGFKLQTGQNGVIDMNIDQGVDVISAVTKAAIKIGKENLVVEP